MSPPRLVLDTNVLLSALLFHTGAVSWLRAAWQSETIRPLASRDTTAELIRVLAYPKFRLTDGEREDLLADTLPWCETVTMSDPPARPEPIRRGEGPPAVPDCRDPLDRRFLELALTAQADALVTGDADLRALAARFSVPILTPRAVKDRWFAPGKT